MTSSINGQITKSAYRSGYDLPPLPLDQFLDHIAQMPQEKEVIEGALVERQLGLIAGDPWTGKSLEEQRVACSFEAGAEYHGLKLEQSRTAYLTWEGSTKGIADRFRILRDSFSSECQPILKLMPRPVYLNTDEGYQEMGELLQHVKDQYGVRIVLLDSFPYTVKGNYRRDEVVEEWHSNIMQLVQRIDITPIVVFELRKLTMWGGAPEDYFNLERLKGAKTVGYKCHMVMMVGESKRQRKVGGVLQWFDDGHRIVIKKAKDARGPFDPLAVELNRNTLLFEGERWAWSDQERRYKAVNGNDPIF